MPRRVIVDTDTASDDALALAHLATSDAIEVAAVTVVAGNVAFDRQVENAKYALRVAGAGDVPVHEGATEPLQKSYETAEEVHGEGGLGDLDPETDVPSADEGAVDRLVRAARAESGAFDLVCLGPLTNVALALEREPDLAEGFDSIWVMGGARNCLGNVTPAAEFNFWVDPDAARRVLSACPVTLVDWGLCTRDGVLLPADQRAIQAAADEVPLAAFFEGASARAAAVGEGVQDLGGAVHPDLLAAALVADESLVEAREDFFVDVDDREGLTRGYSLVDERGVLDRSAGTDVITAADRDGFARAVRATFAGEHAGTP